MSNGKRVYVLGGYQTDFARNWAKENKHILAMMRETVLGGLHRVKIDAEELSSAFISNASAGLLVNQTFLGGIFMEIDPSLGMLPTYAVEAACASGGAALLSAAAHILSGMTNLACVLGVEQMRIGEAKRIGNAMGSAYLHRESLTSSPVPGMFAHITNRYRERFGLADFHLAAITEKNYRNAKRNSNALTRDRFMDFDHALCCDEYNPLVSEPLKASDCSKITDGGACVFLASRKRAEAYCKKRNLNIDDMPFIKGWGHTTGIEMTKERIDTMCEGKFLFPAMREAIRQAYRKAGITNISQIDVIEAHDGFSIVELVSLEHLLMRKSGSGTSIVESGIIEIDGDMPVNPSGGLMGVGHPIGASGVRQMLDLSLQIRGQAGGYQLQRDVKTGVMLSLGGIGAASVCLVVGNK